MLLLLTMAAMGAVMGSVGADARPLHGSLDGDRLVLTTADGTRCIGHLDQVGPKGGLASFNCADGRTGAFGWTYVRRDLVTGEGLMGGEDLSIRIEVENPTQF